MNKMTVVLGIVLIGTSWIFLVSAEPLDGAKILQREAQKARQIEALEYEAKLIEQKAKLAKAYRELQQNGGVLPGEEGSFTVPQKESQPNVKQSQLQGQLGSLPKLRSISGRQAFFEINKQVFRASPGSQLPGGFTVVTVSETSGVELAHGDSLFVLDIDWAKQP